MSDDLNKLFPNEVVQVAGEPVTVHPFYFGQLSRVAKFCRPIAETLMASGILTVTKSGDNQSTFAIDKDFIPKLFVLMAEGSEPLLGLIAYACDKPREWLDKVPVDDGITLAQKVWEINSDFFVKRVMPMLASKLSGFVSIGETSSPASSAPATAAPISTDIP